MYLHEVQQKYNRVERGAVKNTDVKPNLNYADFSSVRAKLWQLKNCRASTIYVTKRVIERKE